MSKPTKFQAAMAVMAAVTSDQLDDATAADMRHVLDGAASGASLTKALDRALSAARSRTWEQVADAGLAAAADNAPRSARSRLRVAVAAAAAVRQLENRLSGDVDDVQNDTAADVIAHAEIDTVQHVESDADSGADWHAATDTEEEQL